MGSVVLVAAEAECCHSQTTIKSIRAAHRMISCMLTAVLFHVAFICFMFVKCCRHHTDRDTDGHMTLMLALKVTEQSGFDRGVQNRKDSASPSFLNALKTKQTVQHFVYLFGPC